MAKAKRKNNRKKTRKLADRIAEKKAVKPERINPFELHINRQKHDVVGRKTKHDKGLPGVAKAKAEKKRKETLLQEFKRKHKANVFLDKRIGENDPTMSIDEKMSARFTKERQIAEENKMRKRKDIFNLNEEEEELTHYGQSLSHIEKFEDPRSDDDSEDEKMMNDFLRETSFGGFLTKKENPTEIPQIKSRKERIEELIATSKQRKLERQNDKEEMFTLTEKLDSELKDIRSIISKQGNTQAPATMPVDSYDTLVKSLKFEARGKGSERLKTPEEIAAEEKKKLEKLESERLERMQNPDVVSTINKSTHRSADDLDGNFEDESNWKKKKSGFVLRYKDGQLVTSDTDEEGDDKGSMIFGDNEEQSGGEDQDQIDGEDQEDDHSDDESDGGEETDNYSDVESDIDDLSDKETETENIKVKSDSQSRGSKGKIRVDGEIPFTFNIPETTEEFRSWVTYYSASEQATVIERILKCNHLGLCEGNKTKLENFFDILLQYIDEAATAVVDGSGCDSFLNLVDAFVPWMYDLVQMSPENAAECFLKIIRRKQELYIKNSVQYLSGIESVYPKLDTLILFKLVPLFFPTSDFRHKVTTPVMMFMGQILAEGKVNSRQDISSGLFICSIFYEFVSLSKRLVPEVLNFLTGLLTMALDEISSSSVQILRPFKSKDKGLLKPKYPDTCKNVAVHPFKVKEILSGEDISDEFRVTVTWMCLKLLSNFSDLYTTLSSFHELLNPVRVRWNKLSRSIYPTEITDTMESLDAMLRTRRLLTPLMRERKRPQSIKFFEPKIETCFTGRKQKSGGKGSKEEQKLKHNVKREMKGAVRELRRDNQFLAKYQLEERMERDAERKRKVKELYQSLCGQEGDHRKLEKKKRKKK